MDKIYKEIRCVSNVKNEVKFIPENLVNKPGYLDKHGLTKQELPVKEDSYIPELKQDEPKKETFEPVMETNKEEPKQEAKESTEKKGKPEKLKVQA